MAAFRLASTALLVLHFMVCDAFVTRMKFLIASAPARGEISYTRLNGPLRNRNMTKLVGKEKGLIHPQGLAMDPFRRALVVADPDARQVVAFRLHVIGHMLFTGPPIVCARQVEARWVAIDSLGDIFFSDEKWDRILRVPRNFTEVALAWQWRKEGHKAPKVAAAPHPVLLYGHYDHHHVSRPGGIATDGYNIFWANKYHGASRGSVVKAPKQPTQIQVEQPATTQPLSFEAEKSYGLCVAHGNIFFTQGESSVYGVKKKQCCGRPNKAELVTNRLISPRGCAFDGESSVYIADRAKNGIFSFASNMEAIGGTYLTKEADYDDAFGVAIYIAKSYARRWALGPLAAAAAVACALRAPPR